MDNADEIKSYTNITHVSVTGNTLTIKDKESVKFMFQRLLLDRDEKKQFKRCGMHIWISNENQTILGRTTMDQKTKFLIIYAEKHLVVNGPVEFTLYRNNKQAAGNFHLRLNQAGDVLAEEQ